VSIFFAADGSYFAIAFACALTAFEVTHCGKRKLSPSASVGGA
jgi:hypothetical protein